MTLIDRPETERSATELLEVDRLTTALSADWLEQYGVLPLRLDDGLLLVGTWLDRVDPLALDDLRLLFGARITVERYGEHDLRTAIRRTYAPEAGTAEGLIAGLTSEARVVDVDEIPLDDLLHLANEAPVVRLVNLLLIEALDARASDVHLESYQDGLQVRYRRHCTSPRRSSVASRSWRSWTSPSDDCRKTAVFGFDCRTGKSTFVCRPSRRCAARASCFACSTRSADAYRFPSLEWRPTRWSCSRKSYRGRMVSCWSQGPRDPARRRRCTRPSR